MPVPSVLRRPLAAVLALALLAAGCGVLLARGGAAQASGQTLRLSANAGGALRFNTTRLTAHAGKVTVVMRNPGSSGISHGIAVEGRRVDRDGPVVNPGGTSRVTVTLRKGTYEFYCPVSGHKGAGMEGKIVVR